MKLILQNRRPIVFGSFFVCVGFATFGCCGAKLFSVGCCGPKVDLAPVIVTSCSPEDHYQRALVLYEQRCYTKAISIFQELLKKDQRYDYTDNYRYWIGECYYGMGDYMMASEEFEEVAELENANKHEAALLKLGLCQLQMGKRQEALKMFKSLTEHHPNSEYVNKAWYYRGKLSNGAPAKSGQREMLRHSHIRSCVDWDD